MNQERGIALKEIVETKDERGKMITRMMFYVNLAIFYLLMNKYLESSYFPLTFKILDIIFAIIMFVVASIHLAILLMYWEQLKNTQHKRYEL